MRKFIDMNKMMGGKRKNLKKDEFGSPETHAKIEVNKMMGGKRKNLKKDESGSPATHAEIEVNSAYREHLSSYERACSEDPQLESFDSAFQERTKRVISKLASGVEIKSLSFDLLREVTQCLLDMNQDVVKVILQEKEEIWNNEELSSLVNIYFWSTANTKGFCSELENCLNRARRSQMIIQFAVEQFGEEAEIPVNGNNKHRKYEKTLEELKRFKAAGDPFTKEFFTLFDLVYKQQVRMLEKLHKLKSKLDKRLVNDTSWRRVSNVVFVTAFFSVLIFSVGPPPVVVAIADALAIPVGSAGNWCSSVWEKYEKVVRGQKESVTWTSIGTCISVEEMDNISVLVREVEVEIESLLKKSEFSVTEEKVVRLAIDEIKKKLDVFTETIEELEKHAGKYRRNVTKARTVILQRIIRYPTGSWSKESTCAMIDLNSNMTVKTSLEQIEKPHDRLSVQHEDAFMDSSRSENLKLVDGESDAILWDKKSDVNQKEAEIFEAEAKSRRDDGLDLRKDDNFTDSEATSVITSTLQDCVEDNRVELVTEEKKQENVSESSTMVSYDKTPPEHKVFINFRGDNLRHGFVGDLVKALKRDGVNIYTDVDELPCGEHTELLLKGIEESRIALIIFSSGYTESKWCLNELVKIKELMEGGKLLVIPVFYKVEPLEVTQLKGDFGVKFWNLWRINRDSHIIKWKEALVSVASMEGIYLKEHGSESEFITCTVKEVLKRVSLWEQENPSLFSSIEREKSTELHAGKREKHETYLKYHLFGMEQHMEKLEKKLEFDCNETRIVGVVGMPGIGKTTLAVMLHEKWNCQFIRCVPLMDIREKSKDYGLVWLRKTLLEVLLEGKFSVISDKTTHESLKDKLLKTKVFVVLDDVSDKKQLEFLFGDLGWIKKGSKIVITTCDKSLLEGCAHDTYVVPVLNDREAFQLFNYHALDDQICNPTDTFLTLSRMFVDFARGHPLALKLLGRELCGKDKAHWEHKLATLTSSNMMFQDVWKFSTDQLNERQKDVLLDIACFFKSEDEYFVRSLLDSGNPDSIDTVSEVRDLANKFLITISDSRVQMNDMLYTSGKDLGFSRWLRLWNYEDFVNELQILEKSDTTNVRGIFLDMSKLTRSIYLDSLTFITMRNLCYLKIYDSSCPRQCKADCNLYLPVGLIFPLGEVRYFHWVKFPLEELPRHFKPENLVDLRLPYSKIKRVWEGVKDIPRLKWVDLRHSSKLVDLSALSRAENLQRLNLEGCTSLDELPVEIQNMKSLVLLNLRGCIRLSYLPEMNLISLKTLILSGCINLQGFQLISESLEVLHLDGTAIEELPPTIKKLQRLVLLNLKNCKMLKCLPKCLGELKALEKLILSGCSRLENLSDVRESMRHLHSLLLDRIGAKEMPNLFCVTKSEDQASAYMFVEPIGPSKWPLAISEISSLQRLNLSGNDFVSLETDIGQLYNLKWLDMRHCRKLRYVPVLPPRLQYFDAHGCVSLERVANPLALPVLSEQIRATFNFTNCIRLDEDAKDSIISYTRRRSQVLFPKLWLELAFLDGKYRHGLVTKRLDRCYSQSCLNMWRDDQFTGVALCVVILFPGYNEQRNRLLVKCDCVFNNEDGSRIRFSCTVGSLGEPSSTPGKIEPSHVCIGYTSMLNIKKYGEEENEEGCRLTEASFEFQVTDGMDVLEGCEVLKCGLNLVYATDERENICLHGKTVEIPEKIGNIRSEVESYETFFSEAKSDVTLNLQKRLENKGVDLLKEESTSPGNLEKVKMLFLVGFELRLKQMEKVLYATPGKTRIVGVVGMPGTGKTTLATILFEKRGCKFPCHLFLTMSKECRPEQLRRVFLKELLKNVNQDVKEETTHESMKDKLLQTKVFVVLDDVSDKKQLEFLLGDLDWIRKGSKIVITTCDKSLLEGLAHDTYVVPQLNKKEAFQVLTYHAFYKQLCPGETFLSLSRMFVDNVGGNPLALKFLGSVLCGKDEAYSQVELQRVRKSFNMKMRDIWRFSIDQLNERQRDLFLDIVYFFKSEDEYYVRSMLDSGNLEAVSEVRNLAEMFLITISSGQVEMHGQLYALGKELGSPGRHWLCNHKDIDKLTKIEQQEANNVRGIFLDMSEITESIALECMTFTDMRNLLYLKIYDSSCHRHCKADCNLYFPDGLDFPLEEVRYLHWVKFPLQELPPDFRPENLVDLRLPYSKIERVWEGVKDAPRLKWVDLRHSSKLLDLSALSRAENLQRLNLEGCTSLDELPVEIQTMKSLVFLNLRGCIRLWYLPKMNLISLKTLIVSDCSNLMEFQLISESVEFLHLDGTAIKGLPPAIQNLKRLVVLNLKNCKMLECLPNCLGSLKMLDELTLSGCSKLKNLPVVRNSLKHLQILHFDETGANEVPSVSCFTGSEGPTSADIFLQPSEPYSTVRECPGVNGVSSLRRLCLSGNDFFSLEPDIGKLYNLKWLDVKQCKKLRFIPMLPPRLQYFDARGCDSLERVANPLAFPMLPEQIHATFNFSNCNNLDQDAKDNIISYSRWRSQLVLDEFTPYSEGSILETFTETCFPGWEVPAWFSHRASGPVLKQKLPPHWSDNKFTGIALCAVVSFPGYHEQKNPLFVKCNYVFNNEDGSHIRFSCTIGTWSKSCNTPEKFGPSHVFIGYTSTLDIKKHGEKEDEDGCSHTEALFEFQVTYGTNVFEGCEVLKCGFSLYHGTDELRVKSSVRRAPVEADLCIAYSENEAISNVRRESETVEGSPAWSHEILELPNQMITHGIATSSQPPITASSVPQQHSADLIPMVASSSQAGLRRSHSQVFVSFHGAELRTTFVRRLVSTLTDAGVNVFTDNDKGNGIKQQHFYKRIEESKIALAIFSKRYIESNFCLNELVTMDKLAKEGKLLVIPVFYNVRSSELKNLKGEFGRRFKEMRVRYKDEPEKVLKWETSVKSIAKMAGIHSEHYGEDAPLVEATVEAVQRALSKISDGNYKSMGGGNMAIGHVFALFMASLMRLLSPLLFIVANFFPAGKWLVDFLVLVVGVVVRYRNTCDWREQKKQLQSSDNIRKKVICSVVFVAWLVSAMLFFSRVIFRTHGPAKDGFLDLEVFAFPLEL